MKLGGDLVSILNQQEKDFLVYRVKDFSWKPSLWTGRLYIGLGLLLLLLLFLTL